MNHGSHTSQEILAKEILRDLERLLSDLAALSKSGNWELLPNIEAELTKKLARIRMTNWVSFNSPSVTRQLKSIQQQLDACGDFCSIRQEQIKPLIDAFVKKQTVSPSDTNPA